MPLAYRQPGIRISELTSPQVSPLLAAPADVCLIGLSRGFQTRTDSFVLTGTSAIPLPGLPVGSTLSAILSVKDAVDTSKGAADGTGYVLTTDYTVSTANGTITRVGGGGIVDGTQVTVTYNYLPNDYFEPMRFYDMGGIEDRYGPTVTANGLAINSYLSYAASLAFENGAPSVVCQPLLVRATPGDPTTAASHPNATQASTLSTWQDSLFMLRDIEDINILVPIIGQSMTNVGDATQLSVFQAIQDHIKFMKNSDQFVMGIFGEDSSASNTVAQKATLRTHAATLSGRYGGELAEHTVLLSPSKFRRALPIFGQQLYLGGQYAAAAVAGMIASRPVSSSLTRKYVSGFTEVSDFRTLQDKDADAAAGLCVIEQRRGAITIRHGVTTNTTRADKREISVVRAKQRLIESIRDTLDRQIIGNLVADQNAPVFVAATVEAVLAELLQARDIVDYGGIQARLLSIEPTTIQVKFSYRPAFPINYVDVEFSIDMSAGTTTTA